MKIIYFNIASCCFQSISCHYAASDCEYIDVKGTTQEVIANEVLDLVTKKLGKDVADQMDYRVTSSLNMHI